MNIGIDSRALLGPTKTGVGEYAIELIKAILAADSVNRYFIFSNAHASTPTNQIFTQKNVTLTDFHYPNKFFNLAIATTNHPRLDNLITKKYHEPIDCWFSPHLNFTSLSPQTPHILTVHDLSFKLFPEFFTLRQRLWHWAVKPRAQTKRAIHIIVPSANTKNDLIERYHLPPEKISIINPGHGSAFDDQNNFSVEKIHKLKNKYELPDEFILFLGSIEPRKNITGLIKAFEIVSQTLPNLWLIIAGAGGWKNQTIYERATCSPVAKKIKFIGWVKDEEKPALYRIASLFVYPSLYEGFGFPVLEAMSVGTATITSNRSSLPEVAGGGALLVNPINSADIAEKIILLQKNPELKNRLKKAGQIQAQKFSWDNSAKQWLKIIERFKDEQTKTKPIQS
ncbi:MAG: hypothetical protein A2538_03930 [Candidatus Magasanikbacteria bacterium RIFOXYD2_FULL_41_14]|uniref:Glycosyl transferase family 1 domain-containing protein n=1 Tax=Candidatus Magasanikbacteria bacterium RIFOXYD2_FULL_41_14 TaxID=1798709 RepID=A0A1F6PBR0_9BACT|nr:MAG: hypothetical protein A2538_03930 [Candidatus Magasanikbacteria bacterium RIFOXYD2_FULL_41_14]